MKRCVLAVALLGCNSNPAVSDLSDGGADSSTITDAAAMDATPTDAAPDAFTGATVHFVATAVESPSGAPIPDVTVCAFAQPGIPCVITDANGFFDLLLPADSETGLTLAVTGRESVLLPLVTTSADQSGYRIGMSDEGRLITFASALGATFPPTTTGILFADVSSPGTQSGIAGLTSAIAPSSGSGPLYFTSLGSPDSQATSTSVFAVTFYANVNPGEVTATFAPAVSGPTLSCHLYFGGWPSAQRNSVRAPIAAGFDTHVGMECTTTGGGDGGSPVDSGAADGGSD